MGYFCEKTGGGGGEVVEGGMGVYFCEKIAVPSCSIIGGSVFSSEKGDEGDEAEEGKEGGGKEEGGAGEAKEGPAKDEVEGGGKEEEEGGKEGRGRGAKSLGVRRLGGV